LADARKTTKLSPTQTSPYLKAFSEQVFIYDGAMGTEVQKRRKPTVSRAPNLKQP